MSINGEPIGPCVDLHIHDLTPEQFIATMLGKLVRAGFVVFLRIPGKNGWPAEDLYHAHCVWPGMTLVRPQAPIPDIVLHQVRDFCHKPRSLTGLAGHADFEFYNVPDDLKDAIWAVCQKHNPTAA